MKTMRSENITRRVFLYDDGIAVGTVTKSGCATRPLNNLISVYYFLVTDRLEVVDHFLDVDDNNERVHRILSISIQFLAALYDLHLIGVVHRDLKPQNMGGCVIGCSKCSFQASATRHRMPIGRRASV